jgi:hypothetical protein
MPTAGSPVTGVLIVGTERDVPPVANHPAAAHPAATGFDRATGGTTGYRSGPMRRREASHRKSGRTAHRRTPEETSQP